MTSQSGLDDWLKLLPVLNEAQRRWYVAEKALALGRGGLERVHELTGISRPTIRKGMLELRAGVPLSLEEGVRHAGGGRKRREDADPMLSRALDRLLEETTAGEPTSALRWTSKSTRTLAAQLSAQGHAVSARTVDRLLYELGYSQQGNRRNKEGASPPERDEQFRYINSQVRHFIAQGAPVLSIDCKKKELVGEFKNAGKSWRKTGDPREVKVYDFARLGIGKAIPYGVYDVQQNAGMVNVGISHDTAEFAVASIRQWWQRVGRRQYRRAKQILLCADGGGSNGSRNRAWKLHLQDFADATGLAVSVCHYPPGTSKWNKIEHRMFSFISMNWRGEPLVSYETVVNLIGATTTEEGLRVRAKLDRRSYPTTPRISAEEMKTVRLKRHTSRPLWNYTISPHERASFSASNG